MFKKLQPRFSQKNSVIRAVDLSSLSPLVHQLYQNCSAYQAGDIVLELMNFILAFNQFGLQSYFNTIIYQPTQLDIKRINFQSTMASELFKIKDTGIQLILNATWEWSDQAQKFNHFMYETQRDQSISLQDFIKKVKGLGELKNRMIIIKIGNRTPAPKYLQEITRIKKAFILNQMILQNLFFAGQNTNIQLFNRTGLKVLFYNFPDARKDFIHFYKQYSYGLQVIVFTHEYLEQLVKRYVEERQLRIKETFPQKQELVLKYFKYSQALKQSLFECT